MSNLISIKHLKKDGTADSRMFLPVIDALVEGEKVIIPVDGIHGVARIPNKKTIKSIHDILPEYVVSDFQPLSRLISISKKEYDFLKRIWPDEITVIMASSEELSSSVHARIPYSPVSHEIVQQSGGIVEFFPLINAKGKILTTLCEIERQMHDKIKTGLIVEEWCKKHPLPTLIDIRMNRLHLVRQGRVSIEDISSLYFLGSQEDG
ncbi:MAG TPA: Sua5/YciO/YrdC/YwlC family protein [Spirochaetota bacterium]|nr:Sua5/YciO/YrdC/YwlC family protein [Spirochaetota bacterium]